MSRTKRDAPSTNRHHAEVLDLAEAAAYLRIAPADVLLMIREQGLPGRQVAGEWRFLKAAVQDWLRSGPSHTGKEAQLALAGAWKDDPHVEEELKEIYRRRGRPTTEDGRFGRRFVDRRTVGRRTGWQVKHKSEDTTAHP